MENNYATDEIEIDLKDLFFELLSEWKKIFASTVLVAAIMFIASAFILTPQYQSTSKLYLIKGDALSSLSDLQLGTSLATDYMEIIDDKPILDEVIDNLGLKDMSYGQLKGMMEFNNPANTRIIEITVNYPDPKIAKSIVDETADVAARFIHEKMKQEKPSVLRYGYIATSPVSPNVIKNTVLGALLGALLAIGIITVTYLLNDTIMTPDDMERKIGLQVLASIPYDEEEDDGMQSHTKKSHIKKKKQSSHKRTSQKSKQRKQSV